MGADCFLELCCVCKDRYGTCLYFSAGVEPSGGGNTPEGESETDPVGFDGAIYGIFVPSCDEIYFRSPVREVTAFQDAFSEVTSVDCS